MLHQDRQAAISLSRLIHADQARRQLGPHVQQLIARHRGALQRHAPGAIDAMQGKHVLRQIDSKADNVRALR